MSSKFAQLRLQSCPATRTASRAMWCYSQAAVDAQTAQENREYAAACLIQRTWRRYKIGHPMPKLELKEPGKKGKKGGKGEKEGRSSPKKGGAKGKGNSSPKKKGEKKASTGKAKGSSSPKAKTKAKAK